MTDRTTTPADADDQTLGYGDEPEPRRRSLFRPEALAHRSRGRGAGRVLELDDRPAALGFLSLMAGLVLALVTSVVLRVDESVSGEVHLSSRTLNALVVLPVSAADRLRAGQPVRMDLEGGGTLHGEVVSVTGPVAAEAVRRFLGERVRTRESVVIVAQASVPDSPRSGSGDAVVRVDRKRLLTILVPGLDW